MPGKVIRAVQKRLVNFSSLPSGASQEVILADRLDVLQWRELTLQVKVHSNGIAAAAGTISINSIAQTLSDDDPGVDFLDRSSVPNVLITSTTPSPGYLTTIISQVQPVGSVYGLANLLRLVAFGSRTGAGAINAVISVEVSAKHA